MMQKLKNIFLTLATMSLFAAPALALAPAAYAAAPDLSGSLCQGTNLDITNNGNQNCNPAGSRNQLQNLLGTVINIFSIVVGVIAVIMIIVGGLRYITSGGDSGKVTSAKTTIIYALIGLVVVAFAQLIVHYVLGQAQSVVGGGGAA
jgi:hypothetical protein